MKTLLFWTWFVSFFVLVLALTVDVVASIIAGAIFGYLTLAACYNLTVADIEKATGFKL